MAETSVHKPPHMRGIKQAIQELKQSDPNTCLTEKALRRLVLTRAVPSVKIGVKYLINMDVLNDYLYNGSSGGKVTFAAADIRKIAE